MDAGLQHRIGTYQHRLAHLLRDGLDLHRALAADPSRVADLAAMRAWQRECAATISQLSGGSKTHWLSRAYSEAFLLRLPGSPGAPETAVGDARVDTIVERILGVLREAQASLAGMGQGDPLPAAAPAPNRFTFVHDLSLRSRLEQAMADAQAAFDRGAYALALVTWASMLEASITDSLERYLGQGQRGEGARRVADWTFEARIAAAERGRLISAGCARLPQMARQYRTLLDESGELGADVVVAERDAKVTRQVLRLILRDLAPGR